MVKTVPPTESLRIAAASTRQSRGARAAWELLREGDPVGDGVGPDVLLAPRLGGAAGERAHAFADHEPGAGDVDPHHLGPHAGVHGVDTLVAGHEVRADGGGDVRDVVESEPVSGQWSGRPES
jgi:hypothetical protein